MSSLPLGFFAPWQPKQFSLRIGATSLIKLTDPFAAWAKAVCGASRSKARASPRAVQRTQKQKRGMASRLHGKRGKTSGRQAGLPERRERPEGRFRASLIIESPLDLKRGKSGRWF